MDTNPGVILLSSYNIYEIYIHIVHGVFSLNTRDKMIIVKDDSY